MKTLIEMKIDRVEFIPIQMLSQMFKRAGTERNAFTSKYISIGGLQWKDQADQVEGNEM